MVADGRLDGQFSRRLYPSSRFFRQWDSRACQRLCADQRDGEEHSAIVNQLTGSVSIEKKITDRSFVRATGTVQGILYDRQNDGQLVSARQRARPDAEFG